MFRVAVISTALFLAADTATSASVTSVSEQLTADRWRNHYEVAVRDGEQSVGLFSIYFDFDQFESLTASRGPESWDVLEFQPDAGLGAAGLLDALALAEPIAPGEALGGFSIEFNYLGDGSPGSQAFEIFDSTTFASIEVGETSPIPIPAPVWLLFGALGLLSFFPRRQ